MALTVGDVVATSLKGIVAPNGVNDAVFKNSSTLKRFYDKKKVYSGERLTRPFNYKDSTGTNGKFYTGSETLSVDSYENITELSFDLKEVEETLVITNRDLARNSGKQQIIKLLDEKMKFMERALRERMTKGIFSDGTAATGNLTTAQFVGTRAFLQNGTFSYGGVSSADISQHVAYVLDNSGVNRSLSQSLIQAVIGGASEGNIMPTMGVATQGVMNAFINLLAPYQVLGKDNVDGLGHKGGALVYSGVDFFTDNLAPANTLSLLNEDFVNLHVHPDFDMKTINKDSLETNDSIMARTFLKGVFSCGVLRYQGYLKDLLTA